ncbi:MAG: ATP-binding protein [Acidimicrobiales bacterium]
MADSVAQPAPLVGRAKELDEVLRGVSARPGLVMVEGEAGIGKTRLIQEVCAHPSLAAGHVLVGGCHADAAHPFGVVVEAVRGVERDSVQAPLTPVAGALRALLPELAGWLPPWPEGNPDERDERFRLARGLRDLLAALGPTVLVLEDLHWADASTLEFLSFVVPQIPERLAVLVTFRREDLDPASIVLDLAARIPPSMRTRVVLTPLGREEAHRMICRFFPGEKVSEDLTGLLHEWTGGLPQLIEEVVHCLGGRATFEPGNLKVPWVVADGVSRRTATVGSDARLVLQACAVAGAPTREELLVAITGLDLEHVRRAICELMGGTLLHDAGDGHYRLRHPLACRAVYESIPGPRLRSLHLWVATALQVHDRAGDPARLAHHFRMARCHSEWTRYAEEAADAASAAGEDSVAAGWLEEVMAARGLSLEARRRIAAKLAVAGRYSGASPASVDILVRALEEAPSATERGMLRRRLGFVLHRGGDHDAGREEMTKAAFDLAGRPELAAQVLADLALPWHVGSPASEHLDWLRQAVAKASAQDDPAVHAAVAIQRAVTLMCLGDPDGWAAVSEIPTDVAGVKAQLQLMRGYYNLAMGAFRLGYDSRAGSLLQQAGAMCTELGQHEFGPWLETAGLALCLARGQWEGLEGRVSRLLDLRAGIPPVRSGSQFVLGMLQLSRGKLQDAEGHLIAVVSDPGAAPVPRLAGAAAGLARLHLSCGHLAEARRAAGDAMRYVRDKANWVWADEAAPVAVEVLLASDDAAAARALVADVRQGLAGRDAPAARAGLWRCRGAVAAHERQMEAARRCFAEEERVWRGLGRPYLAAQAAERRGDALLGAGEPAGAGVLLAVLEAFDRVGADWDVARVRKTLRSNHLALPYPWRGGRRRCEGLSPRQEEVAHLAAKGDTNRQIAEVLIISARTVEVHVATAMKKLGVSSRQQLASVLNDESPAGKVT